MSTNAVTPPPPPTNSLVTPLHTDLYQITMAYGYWKTNKHNDSSMFELFFRKSPFKGSFAVFCGIDEVVSFVHHFKFTDEDIEYLKKTPALKFCEPGFFTYLAALDCSDITITSMKQGSVVFPRTPLITVSGPLAICQLIETTLLNLVNFPSLIATNAARMVIAARGQDGSLIVNNKVPKCIEFGLRRAQGPDGGFSASKYSAVGGFDGTANVQAGKLLGLPISGTHAHAYVQSFLSLSEVKGMKVSMAAESQKESGSKDVELLPLVLEYRDRLGGEYQLTNDGELAAFISYGCAFPHAYLCLVDTYDTLESGIRNFILVALALHDCGYIAKGVRLDSGDLASLSLSCVRMFHNVASNMKRPFFQDLDIVASNDINEKALHELNAKGHGITIFGIGTNLVTCQAQPALGCVFKLVQLNGQPRIKLSNEVVKILIPGSKRAFRLFDADGTPKIDLLIEAGIDKVPKEGEIITYREPFTKTEPQTFQPARVEELLDIVWDKKKGAVVQIPSLLEAKKLATSHIKSLPATLVHPNNPTTYTVAVSLELHKKLHDLWESGKAQKM